MLELASITVSDTKIGLSIAPNKWKIKNKLRDGVILWSLRNHAGVNTAWIESTLAYLKVRSVTVEVGWIDETYNLCEGVVEKAEELSLCFLCLVKANALMIV